MLSSLLDHAVTSLGPKRLHLALASSLCSAPDDAGHGSLLIRAHVVLKKCKNLWLIK